MNISPIGSQKQLAVRRHSDPQLTVLQKAFFTTSSELPLTTKSKRAASFSELTSTKAVEVRLNLKDVLQASRIDTAASDIAALVQKSEAKEGKFASLLSQLQVWLDAVNKETDTIVKCLNSVTSTSSLDQANQTQDEALRATINAEEIASEAEEATKNHPDQSVQACHNAIKEAAEHAIASTLLIAIVVNEKTADHEKDKAAEVNSSTEAQAHARAAKQAAHLAEIRLRTIREIANEAQQENITALIEKAKNSAENARSSATTAQNIVSQIQQKELVIERWDSRIAELIPAQLPKHIRPHLIAIRDFEICVDTHAAGMRGEEHQAALRAAQLKTDLAAQALEEIESEAAKSVKTDPITQQLDSAMSPELKAFIENTKQAVENAKASLEAEQKSLLEIEIKASKFANEKLTALKNINQAMQTHKEDYLKTETDEEKEGVMRLMSAKKTRASLAANKIKTLAEKHLNNAGLQDINEQAQALAESIKNQLDETLKTAADRAHEKAQEEKTKEQQKQIDADLQVTQPEETSTEEADTSDEAHEHAQAAVATAKPAEIEHQTFDDLTDDLTVQEKAALKDETEKVLADTPALTADAVDAADSIKEGEVVLERARQQLANIQDFEKEAEIEKGKTEEAAESTEEDLSQIAREHAANANTAVNNAASELAIMEQEAASGLDANVQGENALSPEHEELIKQARKAVDNARASAQVAQETASSIEKKNIEKSKIYCEEKLKYLKEVVEELETVKQKQKDPKRLKLLLDSKLVRAMTAKAMIQSHVYTHPDDVALQDALNEAERLVESIKNFIEEVVKTMADKAHENIQEDKIKEQQRQIDADLQVVQAEGEAQEEADTSDEAHEHAQAAVDAAKPADIAPPPFDDLTDELTDQEEGVLKEETDKVLADTNALATDEVDSAKEDEAVLEKAQHQLTQIQACEKEAEEEKEKIKQSGAADSVGESEPSSLEAVQQHAANANIAANTAEEILNQMNQDAANSELFTQADDPLAARLKVLLNKAKQAAENTRALASSLAQTASNMQADDLDFSLEVASRRLESLKKTNRDLQNQKQKVEETAVSKTNLGYTQQLTDLEYTRELIDLKKTRTKAASKTINKHANLHPNNQELQDINNEATALVDSINKLINDILKTAADRVHESEQKIQEKIAEIKAALKVSKQAENLAETAETADEAYEHALAASAAAKFAEIAHEEINKATDGLTAKEKADLKEEAQRLLDQVLTHTMRAQTLARDHQTESESESESEVETEVESEVESEEVDSGEQLQQLLETELSKLKDKEHQILQEKAQINRQNTIIDNCSRATNAIDAAKKAQKILDIIKVAGKNSTSPHVKNILAEAKATAERAQKQANQAQRLVSRLIFEEVQAGDEYPPVRDDHRDDEPDAGGAAGALITAARELTVKPQLVFQEVDLDTEQEVDTEQEDPLDAPQNAASLDNIEEEQAAIEGQTEEEAMSLTLEQRWQLFTQEIGTHMGRLRVRLDGTRVKSYSKNLMRPGLGALNLDLKLKLDARPAPLPEGSLPFNLRQWLREFCQSVSVGTLHNITSSTLSLADVQKYQNLTPDEKNMYMYEKNKAKVVSCMIQWFLHQTNLQDSGINLNHLCAALEANAELLYELLLAEIALKKEAA